MDVGTRSDDRLWVIADVGDEAMGSLGSVLESVDRHWLLGSGLRMWRTELSEVGAAQYRHSDADADVAARAGEFLGHSSTWFGR